MPVDEFGREIPAGGGGAASGIPPAVGGDSARIPHRGGGGGRGRSRSRSRSPGGSGGGRDRYGRGRGGGGGDRSRDRYGRGGGGGGGDRRDYYGRGASDDRGGRGRSRSPSPSRGGDRRGGGGGAVGGRSRSRSQGSAGVIGGVPSGLPDRKRLRSRSPSPGGGGGGGGSRPRGESAAGDRSRSPPPRGGRSRSPPPSGGGRDRSRSHGGRPRSHSHDHRDRHHSRGRDGRGDHDRRDNRRDDRHHRHGGGRPGRRRRRHPSERYADEPMLCEYLWKEEREAKKKKKKEGKKEGVGEPGLSDEAGKDAADNKDGDGESESEAVKREGEEMETADDAGGEATKTTEGGDDGDDDDDTAGETYSAYVSSYCLRYVRTYFNTHIDDPWFRTRYSPLERKRFAATERERAAEEARTLGEECESSLREFRESGGGDTEGEVCDFVKGARLGGGVKPAGGGGVGGGSNTAAGERSAQSSAAHPTSSNSGPTPRKRKYSTDKNAPHYSATAASTSRDLEELLERDSGVNRVPPSHVHTPVSSGALLAVMDVPPHVTDEQLSFALGEHADDSKEGGVKAVYSGPVNGVGELGGGDGANKAVVPTYSELKGSGGADHAGANGGGSEDLLYRTAWAMFASEAARDKMIANLTKANVAANRYHRGDSRDPANSTPKVLELDVDCTDPYGRYEIDHDGKGGAPPAEDFSSDNEDDDAPSAAEGAAAAAAAAATAKKDAAKDEKGGDKAVPATTAKAAPRVPLRRSTVFISTTPVVTAHPRLSVLSAAVSSSSRIASDRLAAVKIGRALDASRLVPRGARLDDVLERLFFGGEEREEDVLDVAVAYLRRVHLFSFYNGCTAATSLGACLGGSHPSGTVHLRLSGADDILKKAEEEMAADGIYDDLPDVGGDGEKKNKKEGGGEEGEDSAEKKDGGDDTIKEPQPQEGDDDNADENGGKQNPPAISTDMLVTRHETALTAAVDATEERASLIPDDVGPDVDAAVIVVSHEIDRQAAEVAYLQNQAKSAWVDKHAVIDGDGRARCSFHFCRKLFKDRAFLGKHLHKKHPEFMRAEAGKCHDEYMMRTWDAESRRPVPPVLVECGSKFGMVPAPVVGAAEPVAGDPEPDLWRGEQERLRRIEEEGEARRERKIAYETMRVEEERRREEREAARAAAGGGSEEGGGTGASGRKRKADSGFVDVDDMQEEKVELSFENLDVMVAPPSKKKKKKKKKKLL